MAAKWVDLLRMRIGSAPSVTQAITRPNISFLQTPLGALRIRDSGGPAPSVIFACDAPNVLEHYDALFALLSPSSHRLICVEMPGFGFSYPAAPAFDFSLRQYVDVVGRLVEDLRAGPATLMFPCAWSYVAFRLAAERPALVERLVVSQCPGWDEERAWSRRIDTRGVLAVPVVGQLFMAANQKRISDSWYGAALPKGQATDEFAGPARKVLSDGGIFCLASLMQTWFHAKSPSFMVQQPTVVMWGGSDRTHRHSKPSTVLKYLKRGIVITYPESGHFPELEDPERFKSLLLDEELWNGLRTKSVDLKSDSSSARGVGDDISESAQLVEPRKPFDSHL